MHPSVTTWGSLVSTKPHLHVFGLLKETREAEQIPAQMQPGRGRPPAGGSLEGQARTSKHLTFKSCMELKQSSKDISPSIQLRIFQHDAENSVVV